MTLILLAGCATPCPQIPQEALKPLPDIKMPAEPALNTKKLIDSKTGQPAGLFFPTESAFKEATYKVDLRESAELGRSQYPAANKIFEILRQPPKRWWQLWK